MSITAVLILRLTWVGVFAGNGRGGEAIGGLPARADIVDSNGVPLVRTMDAYSIAVRPSKLIGDPSELARKMPEIFPDDPEATLRSEERRVRNEGVSTRISWASPYPYKTKTKNK